MILNTTNSDTITTNPKKSLCVAMLIALFVVGFAHQAEAGYGLLYYAHEDGQVRGLDMYTGDDAGISIPANSFVGEAPDQAACRNIAYDPDTDLMWYSASDNTVRSVVVSTLAAGPTISDINDGADGASRTIAIDRNARRLYISNSNGNVEVYELLFNTKMYTIHVSAFGLSEPNPGNLRRLAAAEDGNLWYAADDGTFKEFDPFELDPHYTGGAIPVIEQIETEDPKQHRSVFSVRWSAGANYLYYASSDGTVRVASLNTLTNVNLTIFAAWFQGSTNPGAVRGITVDPTWTPSGNPPAAPHNISATDGLYQDRVWVSWPAVTNADRYVVFRLNPDTGTWMQWLFAWGLEMDDSTVVPGVVYQYAVKACNFWGCSDLSTATDTGFAAEISPPTGVNASQGTLDDRVRVNWNSVPGAVGYQIVRQPGDGGMPDTVWVEGTTYDDVLALPAGSFWQYSVLACSDPSTCSGSNGSVWGWIGTFIFVDGFESGDLSRWTSVHQ